METIVGPRRYPDVPNALKMKPAEYLVSDVYSLFISKAYRNIKGEWPIISSCGVLEPSPMIRDRGYRKFDHGKIVMPATQRIGDVKEFKLNGGTVLRLEAGVSLEPHYDCFGEYNGLAEMDLLIITLQNPPFIQDEFNRKKNLLVAGVNSNIPLYAYRFGDLEGDKRNEPEGDCYLQFVFQLRGEVWMDGEELSLGLCAADRKGYLRNYSIEWDVEKRELGVKSCRAFCFDYGEYRYTLWNALNSLMLNYFRYQDYPFS